MEDVYVSCLVCCVGGWVGGWVCGTQHVRYDELNSMVEDLLNKNGYYQSIKLTANRIGSTDSAMSQTL